LGVADLFVILFIDDRTRHYVHPAASSPEEMATDQFGSGGGFSTMFNQSPNASWQSAAVAKYLATVDPSSLPPSGSFPALGRATPDVSALGEGYQVIVNGAPVTVGGTSVRCRGADLSMSAPFACPPCNR